MESSNDPHEAYVPEQRSLKRRAVRGAVLSVLNVGGVQILRLAGNLIVTRLLFPEAYGLMLMVLVLNQGLQMLSDVGILPNIIQHERGDDRDFLDTAWTIQILRGLLLTVLAASIAWPYAAFYEHSELFALVLFASAEGVVSGLNSTKLATLNRRIELGRLVFVNLIAQAVTVTVMVTWAVLSPTVWSLLGGALAGDMTRMVLSHLALPGRMNRLRWDARAARVIFDFGKWIFLSTLVTYLGLRFDSIALGKLVSLEALGVYNIGQSLAALPILVTGQVVIWVLLPAFSESYRGDPASFAANVRRGRRVLNAAGVLMIASTAVFAPAFFYLLYDARYHDAGWMVQLLMLPTWFFFLHETSVRVQLAMGDSRAQMIANLAKLGGTVPGALVGYWLAELPGLIAGLAAGSFAGYATVAVNLRDRKMPILAGDLAWTLAAAGLALVGGGLPWLVGPRLGVDPQLASLPIGTAVIAPYAVWSGRLVMREIRRKA